MYRLIVSSSARNAAVVNAVRSRVLLSTVTRPALSHSPLVNMDKSIEDTFSNSSDISQILFNHYPDEPSCPNDSLLMLEEEIADLGPTLLDGSLLDGSLLDNSHGIGGTNEHLVTRQKEKEAKVRQDSTAQYSNVMDSLIKMQKIGNTAQAKDIIISWIPKINSAFFEEVARIKDEDLKQSLNRPHVNAFRELYDLFKLYNYGTSVDSDYLKHPINSLSHAVIETVMGCIQSRKRPGVTFDNGVGSFLDGEGERNLNVFRAVGDAVNAWMHDFEREGKKHRSHTLITSYTREVNSRKQLLEDIGSYDHWRVTVLDKVAELEGKKERKVGKGVDSLKDALGSKFAAYKEYEKVGNSWEKLHSGDSLTNILSVDKYEYVTKELDRMLEETVNKLQLEKDEKRNTDVYAKIHAGDPKRYDKTAAGEQWPVAESISVGAEFCSYVEKHCLFARNPHDAEPEMVQAFKFKLVSHNMKRYGLIEMHEDWLRILTASKPVDYLQHRYLPMLVKPLPWENLKKGAYYTLNPGFVRKKEGTGILQTKALERSDLKELFNRLDELGAVAWKINKRVFDVVTHIFEVEGGGKGDLPYRDDEFIKDATVSPEIIANKLQVFCNKKTKRPHKFAELPKEHKVMLWQFYKEEARVKLRKRNNHSQRSDTLLKLAQAKEFIDDVIYFPHNLDFRGRVYPIPPNFNHMGNDLCRGLLLFNEKRRLGYRGLRWLKIHVANLAGVDKCSNDDRVKFTESNIHHILEIGNGPEGPLNNRWWLNSENPWQTLAATLDLADAINSGDPENYLSSLPVHQDGSCNGLQHYAALGRDKSGGTHVNLTPGPKPGDVYSGVCDKVRAKVAAEAKGTVGLDSAINSLREHEGVLDEIKAAEEEEEADDTGLFTRKKFTPQEIATILIEKNVINRKLVKQTVMTSVYGVTYVGARAQIENRLRDLTLDGGPLKEYADTNFTSVASNYLAKHTLAELNDLFQEARGIMKWLGHVAGEVTKNGQPVSWMTPLGMPVIQPYRDSVKFTVKTRTQTVSLVHNKESLPVSGPRQRSAFPPNFVHSLDSTHMLMTSKECNRRGIVFSAVHDSFWSHAGSVDEMNTILREQFVELYNQPILENLRNDLKLRNPLANIDPVPARGTLDIEEVKKSQYFFS
jgi:hypothetical protein